MKQTNTKRLLVSMIGVDYSALLKTSSGNVNRFFLAAICVAAIFVLTAVSVYYAFELMFHRWYAQLLLSVFISAMIGVIYILLIQTFSKQPLAHRSGYRLNASNLLRGGFLLFIGFLISKPIEILALSSVLDQEISTYRSELTTTFADRTHVMYTGDFAKLQRRKMQVLSMGEFAPTAMVQQIDKQLLELKNKEQVIIAKARERIDNADFFLQRVKFATARHKLSWMICMIIVALFFIPAALVYSVSSENEYYVDKKRKEQALVLAHYFKFTQLYTQAFHVAYDMQGVGFYERHLDPPFRTERMPKPECEAEKEFFNRFPRHGLPERLL